MAVRLALPKIFDINWRNVFTGQGPKVEQRYATGEEVALAPLGAAGAGRHLAGKAFLRTGAKVDVPKVWAPQVAGAGDDVARAAKNTLPEIPAAGRRGGGNFPTSFAVKSAGVTIAGTSLGYGVYKASGGISNVIDATKGAPDPFKTFRDTTRTIFEETRETVGGAASAFPVFLRNLLEQPAEGAKNAFSVLAVPALLVGGGILLFGALKK